MIFDILIYIIPLFTIIYIVTEIWSYKKGSKQKNKYEYDRRLQNTDLKNIINNKNPNHADKTIEHNILKSGENIMQNTGFYEVMNNAVSKFTFK